MTIEIRTARPEEYAAVGALTENAYRQDGYLNRTDGSDVGYGEELRDAASRARGAELIVAVDGETLLGGVTWCPAGSPYRELATRDDQGEFRMLAVAPAARRRGIGRLLVQWCIDRDRAEGMREIVMCSLTTMTTAHALYAGLGFTRAPELDWSPVPDVTLLGFRLPLDQGAAADEPLDAAYPLPPVPSS